MPRLQRRHVLGGNGRDDGFRVRGLSRELAAGDGLGSGLVPLPRGLPAGGGRLRGVSGGDVEGGGRQLVRIWSRLRAAQRLLRVRGERDDAFHGLGAIDRVRVPAGV